MDANGIVYKRNEKKLAALSRFLASTGRYNSEPLDLATLSVFAESLENVHEDANKGIVTADQYYMTLLVTLPINPVDYSGALNAIHEAEYNISLFPDVESVLKQLKTHHGVKLAIVTDSMASTAEKKKWMQQAGMDIEVFDVIVNSSDMGFTKPDPRMYQTALDTLGVLASDSVFLGHRASELLGAKSVGCSTLVMFPDADLLQNGAKPLAQFDFYVPSWKHLLDVPMWGPPSL
jgi:putative hydrolase of the HAD superfamily